MARTTNDSRKRIRSNRRKLDNSDEHMWRPWASIDREILLVVLMKIGLIDFLSFSGVCRSWRSTALSHRDTFMAGKEPLMVIKSPYAMKACSLLDLFNRGRRYKTLLPDVSGQSCVGLSCGYLIMLRRNYAELSIVNPITRHELHFPAISHQMLPIVHFRAIVVYSSSLSKFIMIVVGADYKSLLLATPGGSKWVVFRYSVKVWDIVDLTYFKGKIYVLNRDGSLGEMRLKPVISLKLLNVQSIIPSSQWVPRQLVTSSECLFMVDPARVIVKHELDFEKMEWILRDDLGGNALFVSDIKCCAVVNTSSWRDRGKAHYNSTYYLDRGSWNGQGSPMHVLAPDDVNEFRYDDLGYIPFSWNSKSLAPNVQGDLWYFPHECYKVNTLAADEE